MAWADGDECEAHELAFCSICKPQYKAAPPDQRPGGAPRFRTGDTLRVLAKFDGWCVECGDRIEADVDYLRRDDDGKWVHEVC